MAQHLGIDPRDLERLGACNLRIDCDNRFYIEARLLRRSKQPELQGASADVDARFDRILAAVARSQRRRDSWWRQAVKLATFAEPPGLFLGYGKLTANGRGVGEVLATEIVEAAANSLELGQMDIELFEMFVVFDSGIGHDRLGDMVAEIVYPRLLAYSERVFGELKVSTSAFGWRDRVYYLPMQPGGKRPFVLAPRDILAYLPHGNDWQDVVRLCENSARLRSFFNEKFGERWKAKINAGLLRRTVLADRTLASAVVDAFRASAPPAYDFSQDPKGLTRTTNEALALVRDRPLRLALPANPTQEQAAALVMQICDAFAHHVEHGGSTKLLWVEEEPREEKIVQQLFHDIAKAYCDANNLDVSPETNAGLGAVDFKFSQGAQIKVLVEIKRADHRKLKHGLEVQLKAYGLAEQTNSLVYLIVDYGTVPAATEKARSLIAGRVAGPRIYLVDASRKLSASVAPAAVPPATA